MSRYTYTLHPENSGGQPRQTYRRSQLDKMTTFQLREICRRERLVVPARENGDREGLIRLIMYRKLGRAACSLRRRASKRPCSL